MMRGLFRATSLFGVFGALLLPSCSSSAEIDEIITAIDPKGIRPRNQFYTDSKQIFCIVKGKVSTRGVTLELYVRQSLAYDFNLRRTFDSDRVLAYAESGPGQGPLELPLPLPKISQADGEPYEFGRYECEAWIDGHREASAIFNVLWPPCPPATVTPGAPCYGFYEEDRACPRYGESSSDPAACRCTKATGWECL
jgi:hypothetical protein